MRNSLLHPLSFPSYHSLKRYEGKGNYAIWKYYKFPYRFFYRHKLRMMVDMMDKDRLYRNCLDFGSGPGIFTRELKKHSLTVKNLEVDDPVDPRWKFDIIICGSVLEFVHLDSTLQMLRDLLSVNGQLIAASPMSTKWSKLYFDFIKDKNMRNTQKEIFQAIERNFWIKNMKEWLGLYFCIKAIR